ncbi:ComEA family DNA-binding protein [Clavibacter phaseoli]|uniref:ComEA family DNA-binding protein n=1 Tax=Clavibacter phaseoli TaxID=1734031 RepID=UPI0036F23308
MRRAARHLPGGGHGRHGHGGRPLETLPRVGPAMAARIIAWRSAHGRFTRVADLGRVPGIGDRTLASLTPLVRV